MTFPSSTPAPLAALAEILTAALIAELMAEVQQPEPIKQEAQ